MDRQPWGRIPNQTEFDGSEFEKVGIREMGVLGWMGVLMA
jgi:hypothetical protein